MIPITRKLIFVRLPMSFAAPDRSLIDENGLVTTFGDSLAYAAFAEGLTRFATDGIDVTLRRQRW